MPTSQATLSRALEDEWRSIQNRPTSKEMTTDPMFLNPVNRLSDLKKQTTYAGQIINKTEYGYFIDIGIQENGLLHNNQLSNNVSYAIGDVIDVQLLSCNPEKQQYALTVPGKTTKPRKNQKNKASNKTRAIGNSAMADALKAALNKEN